jgi:hypothetical protein
MENSTPTPTHFVVPAEVMQAMMNLLAAKPEVQLYAAIQQQAKPFTPEAPKEQ